MDELIKIIIGISGTVLGGFLGYFIRLFIEHRLAIDRIKENIKLTEFNKAASELRAAFASHLAYLRGYEGSIQDTETIREKLYAGLVGIHASELQKFRFHLKSKGIEDYDNACERYEEQLHPGFIVKPKDQEPSEYFIAEIEKLLNFTK